MQTYEEQLEQGDLGDVDKRTLDRLGALYAMEAAAARSYQTALISPYLVPYRHALRAIHDSHQERMRILRDRLLLAGAEPPHTYKIVDSLLTLLEDTATGLGASTAFNAFEQGEAHCRKQYMKALQHLDPPNREFLLRELLPRHSGSHAVISALRQEN